jgi:hypothetical protein
MEPYNSNYDEVLDQVNLQSVLSVTSEIALQTKG